MSQTLPTGKRYYKREWLNLPGFHSIAYVFAEIEEPAPYNEGSGYVPYVSGGYLTVGDCSRSVTLTFEVDPESAPNTLHKLDLLESTIREFRQHVEALMVVAATNEALRKQFYPDFPEPNHVERQDQTANAGTGSGAEAPQAGSTGSE